MADQGGLGTTPHPVVRPTRWLVRDAGGWWRASADEIHPRRIDLGEARRLVDGTTSEVSASVAIHADDLVERVPTVVVALGSAGAQVVNEAGEHVKLGPEALDILDILDDPLHVGELLHRLADHDPEVLQRGLTALLAAHRVRLTAHTGSPSPDQHVDSDETTAHQPDTAAPEPPPPPVDERTPARSRRTGRFDRALSRLRNQARRGATRPAGPSPEPTSGRIAVFALWPEGHGPPLSLGMVLAYARSHAETRLAGRFEIHRLARFADIADALGRHHGPAVLLCTDYRWCTAGNLESARRLTAAHRGLVVIHGGPDVPGLPHELASFLRDNRDAVDIAVHGEGEETLVDVLERIAADGSFSPEEMRSVPGISYLAPNGEVIRTEPRERAADLDHFPSPYLSGEFDHLEVADFSLVGFLVETNRGCPYGCTFCDWGSATLSRVRKFDLDRVRSELTWAIERGINAIFFADANFGIFARDVEIAAHLAELRRRTGLPESVSATLAKNTTRHFTQILDLLLDAGVAVTTSLSIQTQDDKVLRLVDRSNIATGRYLEVARDFRSHGVTPYGDLLLGMPGQTVATYKQDLQFMLDHEVTARTWAVQVLPNAPMNRPDYREAHGIVTDDRRVVVSTASFTEADREHMLAIRLANTVGELFGVFRHPMRFLQWEHDIPAVETMDRLVQATETDPDRYPPLTWMLRHFRTFLTDPAGWIPVFDDFRHFVSHELGVPGSSALDAVLEAQRFILPTWGRTLPSTLELAHDYVQYYFDAVEQLDTVGTVGHAVRPLGEYPPARLTVESDPLGICERGAPVEPDGGDPFFVTSFHFEPMFELRSPLMRNLPALTRAGARLVRSTDDPSAGRRFIDRE